MNLGDGDTFALVCFCDVEEACEWVPFHYVWGTSIGSCVVTRVFLWSLLYDAGVLGLLGKVEVVV